MNKVNSLKVTFHDLPVGKLTMGPNGCCLFQYSRSWQKMGFSISPYKLPLSNDIYEAPYLPFGGNFGVFEDSMPGAYGEYMLKKTLRKEGIDYSELDPIQKLSLVGHSGMGALCYYPTNEIRISDSKKSLETLQQEVFDVMSEKTDENVEALYHASGNSGGVRPKTKWFEDGKHWLVKLRLNTDPVDAGKIEYLYNQAAKEAGITVPEFRLFEGKFFGSERYDLNPDNSRIHVVTVSGLLDEDINPPKSDYKTILALTGYITQNSSEVEQQFRRMVFNYFAENFDDHIRNFSFLYDAREKRYKLSPAYDMTHDKNLPGHATTVNYKDEPTEDDFIEVGSGIRIPEKRCRQIISEVKEPAEKLLEKLAENNYDIEPKMQEQKGRGMKL